MKMRILFCGDRHWVDVALIQGWVKDLSPGTVIVEGGQRGVDLIAESLAIEFGYPYQRFDADWPRYGLGAGPIRNKAMLDSGVDRVIAFHDDLSKSKGTRNCIKQAMDMGIEVVLVGHGKAQFFHGKEKTSKEEM